MLYIYRLFINLALIISPLIITIRLLKKKENLKRFTEKFGIIKQIRPRGKLIWFHVASVGEFRSIIPLLEKYETSKTISKILITSNTLSSSKIISEIKDDNIYASIGERGKKEIAQNPTEHPGSIIRINLDGSIPMDNPKFVNKTNWASEVFQIGVRNPQGMALSPFNSKIYISNHGARGGDWFGEVEYGTNYGWPILGWGGTNYSGTKIGPKWEKGFKKAIHYWVPSIAISAIQIYKGKEFEEWNNYALISSLKNQSLRILDFKDISDVKENIIFSDKIGRIRDIEIHPYSGKIYLLSERKLWIMEKSNN